MTARSVEGCQRATTRSRNHAHTAAAAAVVAYKAPLRVVLWGCHIGLVRQKGHGATSKRLGHKAKLHVRLHASSHNGVVDRVQVGPVESAYTHKHSLATPESRALSL